MTRGHRAIAQALYAARVTAVEGTHLNAMRAQWWCDVQLVAGALSRQNRKTFDRLAFVRMCETGRAK